MKPPSTSKAELAVALVKGAVSAIPIAGGVISEVGSLYLNPLEKRKQLWMNEVGLAIEEIRERFSRLPDSLENDESFVTFLYQTTILALKYHQREKLEVLRNALVSAADPSSISEDLVFQFIRFIDELSETHLQILSSFEKHTDQMANFSQLEQVYSHFKSATGITLERTMFRSFVQDLDARFLIRIGDLDDFPEYATKVEYIVAEASNKRPLHVTDFGRKFLLFIRRSGTC